MVRKFFLFLVGSGVASSWYSNERGRDLGKADSALVFQSEIKSLRKDSARLEKDLLKSEGEITQLSLKLDTCNSGNSIEKINKSTGSNRRNGKDEEKYARKILV